MIMKETTRKLANATIGRLRLELHSQEQNTNKEELARSWEVSRYVRIFVV